MNVQNRPALPSPDDLPAYVAQLTTPEFVGHLAARSGISEIDVRRRLDDYAGEVTVGVELLEGLIAPGQRILEVGAGVGLLSVWLIRRGASVVLLEVGAGGFDANRRLLDAVLEWFDVAPLVLPLRAEELAAAEHGTFDLIFSVNVLEHIPALEQALASMLAVLAPGGTMRHTCANYAVPYDPHYELPLIPLAPHLTGLLVPAIGRQEVWQSLNFITYGRVVRFCRAHGLKYEFEPGLLAKALRRMEEDAAFRRRRGRLARLAHALLGTGPMTTLVARLPPRWATPMVFSCTRCRPPRT